MLPFLETTSTSMVGCPFLILPNFAFLNTKDLNFSTRFSIVVKSIVACFLLFLTFVTKVNIIKEKTCLVYLSSLSPWLPLAPFLDLWSEKPSVFPLLRIPINSSTDSDAFVHLDGGFILQIPGNLAHGILFSSLAVGVMDDLIVNGGRIRMESMVG